LALRLEIKSDGTEVLPVTDYTEYLSDDGSADNLITYAMVPPTEFKSQNQEMDYLKQARPILRDELYTGYEFLNSRGLLEEFKDHGG
jgi:hypothetical protein